MSKNVATAKEAFDFESLPVPLPDQSNQVGRGSEGVGINDLIIPRLSMIQDLSPQRKKNDPAYIPGAEEGMIFNTVSRQLYGNKIFVVPVYYRKEWVLWKDRLKGGGFGGAFANEELAEAERQRKESPDDWAIQDTHQNFVLVVSPESTKGQFIAEEAVMSMSKSQSSIARQLNTMARMAGGDRFSRMYKFEVVPASGTKGDYFNWKVVQLGATPDALFKRAEEMYEAVSSGQKDVARDDE
jgi:hypothetical protein